MYHYVRNIKKSNNPNLKGLEFSDIGYVLVSGQTAIAGKGDELLDNPDVGRLFLGG